jgi:hypothetical protein
MSHNHKPLPITENGDKFYSAKGIKVPLAVSITTGAFAAVTLGVSCKGFHVSTRDGEDWLISNLSAGTTYATMKSGMYFDIVGEAGDIVFYVKAVVNGTLELVPFD